MIIMQRWGDVERGGAAYGLAMNILVLTAHPDPASLNGQLAAAYVAGAEAQGATVTTIDLCSLAFDPVLRGGFRTPMPDEPDLAMLRERLLAADHVVWFFPVWWAGPPAILKAVIDRVFLPGWAFRFEKGPLPVGLLAGRSTRYVATMDSPRLWYLLAHHDALGGSFGRGTLAFVGFAPVERTLFYGVRTLDARARAAACAKSKKIGERDARSLEPSAKPLAAGGTHGLLSDGRTK